MSKAYDEWGLYDFEKYVRAKEEKGNSFITFLKYVMKNDNTNKVIEILRASGYFISYNDKFVIEEERKREIDDLVNDHFKEKEVMRYKNLKKEAGFLLEKKNELDNKIEYILDQYQISCEELVCCVERQINNVSANRQLSDQQKVSTREYYVYVLGFLLKCIMYRAGTDSGKRKNGSNEEIDKLIKYSFMYRELNEIIQSWMFGNVKIERDENLEIEELPGNNKDRIVSASNYWATKDVIDIKSYFNGLEGTEVLDKYLANFETRLEEKVKEDFYTQNFEEKYLKISLREWIEIFVFFTDKALRTTESVVKIKKEQLHTELSAKGLSEKAAESVVEILTFNQSSNDFFDSFLVNQGEDVLFVPQIYLFIDKSKMMISLFGKAQKKDKNIAQKGKAFEEHIYLLLKNNIGNIQRILI